MAEQQEGNLDDGLKASRDELIARTSIILASFSLSANVMKRQEIAVNTFCGCIVLALLVGLLYSIVLNSDTQDTATTKVAADAKAELGSVLAHIAEESLAFKPWLVEMAEEASKASENLRKAPKPAKES